MRDSFFFPATLILSVVMVALAVWPGVGRLPTGLVTGLKGQYALTTVQGPQLNKIVAGGDARIELRKDPEHDYVLEISSKAGALSDNPKLGPHFVLGDDIQTALAGFRVKCTVWAKPGKERGTKQIALNYYNDRKSAPDWQILTVGNLEEAKPASFIFEMPATPDPTRTDYFAIRPVVPDKSRSIVVTKVEFERLDRWDTTG